VKSDASLLSSDSLLLLEITPEVTQGGDLVADENADDDKDQ